jgi:hypothetical protein
MMLVVGDRIVIKHPDKVNGIVVDGRHGTVLEVVRKPRSPRADSGSYLISVDGLKGRHSASGWTLRKLTDIEVLAEVGA